MVCGETHGSVDAYKKRASRSLVGPDVSVWSQLIIEPRCWPVTDVGVNVSNLPRLVG